MTLKTGRDYIRRNMHGGLSLGGYNLSNDLLGLLNHPVYRESLGDIEIFKRQILKDIHISKNPIFREFIRTDLIENIITQDLVSRAQSEGDSMDLISGMIREGFNSIENLGMKS